MGRRSNRAPSPRTRAPRTLARGCCPSGGRVGTLLFVATLGAAVSACSTLPEPRLDPEGSETVHAVVEMAPGWWHVLVRVNYFSSAEAAERLLRERVADLCPDGDLVLENVQVVGIPRLATADAYCAAAGKPLPPPVAAEPDDPTTATAGEDEAPPATP